MIVYPPQRRCLHDLQFDTSLLPVPEVLARQGILFLESHSVHGKPVRVTVLPGSPQSHQTRLVRFLSMVQDALQRPRDSDDAPPAFTADPPSLLVDGERVPLPAESGFSTWRQAWSCCAALYVVALHSHAGPVLRLRTSEVAVALWTNTPWWKQYAYHAHWVLHHPSVFQDDIRRVCAVCLAPLPSPTHEQFVAQLPCLTSFLCTTAAALDIEEYYHVFLPILLPELCQDLRDTAEDLLRRGSSADQGRVNEALHEFVLQLLHTLWRDIDLPRLQRISRRSHIIGNIVSVQYSHLLQLAKFDATAGPDARSRLFATLFDDVSAKSLNAKATLRTVMRRFLFVLLTHLPSVTAWKLALAPKRAAVTAPLMLEASRLHAIPVELHRVVRMHGNVAHSAVKLADLLTGAVSTDGSAPHSTLETQIAELRKLAIRQRWHIRWELPWIMAAAADHGRHAVTHFSLATMYKDWRRAMRARQNLTVPPHIAPPTYLLPPPAASPPNRKLHYHRHLSFTPWDFIAVFLVPEIAEEYMPLCVMHDAYVHLTPSWGVWRGFPRLWNHVDVGFLVPRTWDDMVRMMLSVARIVELTHLTARRQPHDDVTYAVADKVRTEVYMLVLRCLHELPLRYSSSFTLMVWAAAAADTLLDACLDGTTTTTTDIPSAVSCATNVLRCFMGEHLEASENVVERERFSLRPRPAPVGLTQPALWPSLHLIPPLRPGMSHEAWRLLLQHILVAHDEAWQEATAAVAAVQPSGSSQRDDQGSRTSDLEEQVSESEPQQQQRQPDLLPEAAAAAQVQFAPTDSGPEDGMETDDLEDVDAGVRELALCFQDPLSLTLFPRKPVFACLRSAAGMDGSSNDWQVGNGVYDEGTLTAWIQRQREAHGTSTEAFKPSNPSGNGELQCSSTAWPFQQPKWLMRVQAAARRVVSAAIVKKRLSDDTDQTLARKRQAIEAAEVEGKK